MIFSQKSSVGTSSFVPVASSCTLAVPDSVFPTEFAIAPTDTVEIEFENIEFPLEGLNGDVESEVEAV